MLSICIPVYNLIVEELVIQLASQCIECKIEFEIILVDDYSKNKFRIENKKLTTFSYINYYELPENVGRSKIRNILAKQAKYSYMLFIDCDSLVINKQLIANYLLAINKGELIVCGGSNYSKDIPSLNKRLRWKYGLKTESQQAEKRKGNASKSFMTNNFLIHKKVICKVKFNEKLSKYGHEDTLFGYDLKKENFFPYHIDNPVLNCHLDTNKCFLNKTEQALKNLLFIESLIDNPRDFIQGVTILNIYSKLPLKPFLFILFLFINPVIKILLILGVSNLNLFAMYKLGFLSVSSYKYLKQ